MSLIEKLGLLVELDGKGAVKGIHDIGAAAEKDLTKTDDRLNRIGKTSVKVGAGMIGAGVLIAGAFFKTAQASEDAEQNSRKLENSIANSAKLAGHSAGEFIDLAKAIQRKTAADADEIVGGQAILAQFGLEAKEIKGLTPLVVDLARKKGIDLASASTAVAKGMEVSSGALKKVGVIVDENAYKTDRYTAITDALKRSVGGFAEQEGQTFAGSLERVKNELGDIAEGVGKGAVDTFSSLLEPVGSLAEKFGELDPKVQENIGKFGTLAAGGLILGGGLLVTAGKVLQLKDTFGRLADAAPRVAAGIRGITKAAGYLAALELGGIIQSEIVGDGTHDLNEMTKALLDLAEAGKAGGDGIDIAGLSLDELRDAIGSIAAPGVGQQITHGLFGAFSHIGFTTTLDQMKGRVDGLDKALANLAERNPQKAAASLESLRQQLGDKDFERLRPLLDDYDSALAGIDVNARSAAGGVDEFGNATGDAAENTDALVQGLKDLDDGLHSLFDPLFAAHDAASDLAQAQRDAAAAAKEHGRNSAEAKQANEDAAKAAIDYESSLIRLKAAVQNGDVSVAAAKATLQGFVTQGYLSQTQADQLATSLGDVKTKADALNTDGIQVQLDTRTAQERADALLATLRGLAQIKPGLESGSYPSLYSKPSTSSGKASGGATYAGNTYLVGERGPELLTMGANGYVTPNGAWGGPQTIVVQSVLDGQVIGESVIDYQRQHATLNGFAGGNRSGRAA